MNRFKFLQTKLKYKLRFISGAEYSDKLFSDRLRAQYNLTVYFDKKYEITVIASTYFTDTEEKIKEILKVYHSSDSIHTLLTHLQLRFINAFINNENI